jgi:hypothetical protein
LKHGLAVTLVDANVRRLLNGATSIQNAIC